MFDLVVIPTLRQHYNPSGPDFKRKCREFAQRIGLPRREWYRVTFPAFISLDHDSRHPHLRKLLLTPRFTATQEEQRRLLEISNAFNVPTQRVRTGTTAQRLAVGIQQQVKMQEVLAKYKRDHDVDFWDERKWQLSLTEPGWTCVLAQQYMPLSPVSADLHCPPEHMVCTVKGDVRHTLLDADWDDDALWLGKTYQGFIDDTVLRRGNGDKGLKHIRRSVEKWPCVATILAAEKNEIVKLKFTFGDGGDNKSGRKCEEHEVCGTAGEWIPDTKWT